jgi:carbon monoxide dehydrogenase subunit G
VFTVELQREIAAPIEAVFDLLADHTTFPTWDPSFIDASLTSEGPITGGSRGITVGELMGRRVENEIYYDAYDRPCYVSGGTSSGPVEATNSIDFAPTDTGTLVTFRLQVRTKGFLRLFEPLIKSATIRQKKESLEALNQYLARSGSVGQSS